MIFFRETKVLNTIIAYSLYFVEQINHVEPGVKKYLLRIVNTLSLGLLWLALNSTAGIMYDLAFIHDHVTLGNILFYIWFVVSLGLFLWYVIRLWKEPLDIEQ